MNFCTHDKTEQIKDITICTDCYYVVDSPEIRLSDAAVEFKKQFYAQFEPLIDFINRLLKRFSK